MKKNEILNSCYTKTVEAYMGGLGYEGSNSKSNLYGSDLTKRFREIAKACKIKGVSFSKSRSGSINITVKITDDDIVPYEKIANKIENAAFLRLNMGGMRKDPTNPNKWIPACDFWGMTAAEQKNALKFWAKDWYEQTTNGYTGCICHGWQLNPEEYVCFNEKFFDKWNALTKIVSSYNWNHSNAQVDYFDVHFYEHWFIVKK